MFTSGVSSRVGRRAGPVAAAGRRTAPCRAGAASARPRPRPSASRGRSRSRCRSPPPPGPGRGRCAPPPRGSAPRTRSGYQRRAYQPGMAWWTWYQAAPSAARTTTSASSQRRAAPAAAAARTGAGRRRARRAGGTLSGWRTGASQGRPSVLGEAVGDPGAQGRADPRRSRKGRSARATFSSSGSWWAPRAPKSWPRASTRRAAHVVGGGHHQGGVERPSAPASNSSGTSHTSSGGGGRRPPLVRRSSPARRRSTQRVDERLQEPRARPPPRTRAAPSRAPVNGPSGPITRRRRSARATAATTSGRS